MPRRRKSQSTYTLVTCPSCGCSHPCRTSGCLGARSWWHDSIVCLFVRSNPWLFNHSFSSWGAVVSVSFLCGPLGGVDAVSVVCLVLSKSGSIMLKISHAAVSVRDITVCLLFSRSLGCSFIHSVVWAVQLPVCFQCIALSLILFWFISFYFTFDYTP